MLYQRAKEAGTQKGYILEGHKIKGSNLSSGKREQHVPIVTDSTLVLVEWKQPYATDVKRWGTGWQALLKQTGISRQMCKGLDLEPNMRPFKNVLLLPL